MHELAVNYFLNLCSVGVYEPEFAIIWNRLQFSTAHSAAALV